MAVSSFWRGSIKMKSLVPVRPALIEADHRVRGIRFLEGGDFFFGQLDANRGQRIVEVLQLGGADAR